MENLAQRLKKTREKLGLSQSGLTRKAGLKSQSLISGLERQARNSSTYIPRIAMALGVEALWLAEGKGRKEIGNATQSDRYSLNTDEQTVVDSFRRSSHQVKEFILGAFDNQEKRKK